MEATENLLKQLDIERAARDEACTEWADYSGWDDDIEQARHHECLERRGRVSGFERVLALLHQYGVI